MNTPAFFTILMVAAVIGYMFARADDRDMAICQLSHSEAVCFNTLNR